jgi:hypothetical protein
MTLLKWSLSPLLFTFLRQWLFWHKKDRIDIAVILLLCINKHCSYSSIHLDAPVCKTQLLKVFHTRQAALSMLKCKAAGNWFSLLVTSLSYQFCHQSWLHDQTEATIILNLTMIAHSHTPMLIPVIKIKITSTS